LLFYFLKNLQLSFLLDDDTNGRWATDGVAQSVFEFGTTVKEGAITNAGQHAAKSPSSTAT
jgi:hypothetical protein